MIFENGRVRSGAGRIDNPDVTIFYKDKKTLAELFGKNPEESLDYLLTNEMSYTGNMAYLVFAMDHDSRATGESRFRNVEVYEE